MQILKNDIVQTIAIGFGAILLLIVIGATFIYGYHRETVDPIQEQYDEQFKESRQLRAEYFRQLKECGN